jgi:hypothetical protein
MLVWGIGTLMVIVSAGDFVTVHSMVIIDLFLFLGGWVIIIINETFFSVKKEQLEIDRDETIKTTGGVHKSTILAICPICKTRIPYDSTYCLKCGTNLQPEISQPSIS